MQNHFQIAIIGLGYVGLPLAVEFGKIHSTIGFDLKEKRILECKSGIDSTREVSKQEFNQAKYLDFTSDPQKLARANYLIVAVPTPINESKQPELTPLLKASEIVGENLNPGNIVVYESTVFPGATQEFCVPILEENSNLKWKKDFFVGYSPERLNPGDKSRKLPDITKIVSGDTPEVAREIKSLYSSIISAGIYTTHTIKEAEAAKVIENTQRDLNIALINELAVIFDKMGIDTDNVLQAAGTKWNFLPFRPGLVGGHCIGVDPYYLTYKAQCIDYHPEMILAGRRVNDRMGKYIAETTIKRMIHRDISIKGANVAILGLSFKEDVADIRNTRVIDIVKELGNYAVHVFVHDDLVDPQETREQYDIELTDWENIYNMDALIIATPHEKYRHLPSLEYMNMLSEKGCIIDVKSIFDYQEIEANNGRIWRL